MDPSQSQFENLARQLDETRRILSSLMENVPGVLFTCLPDPSRTMLELSDGFTQLLGFAAQDFIQNRKASFINIVLSEDRGMVLQRVREGIAAHGAYEVEYRVRDLQGGLHWLRERGTAIERHGELQLFGVLYDVTERHAEAERLARSEAFASGVIAALKDPLWVLDRNKRIIWANLQMSERFGDDLVGRTCYEVARNSSLPCDQCFLDEVFTSGISVESELVVERTTGEPDIWLCSASPVSRGPNGQVESVVEIIRDVTQARRREQERTVFVEAFRQLPVALLLTDTHARVQYANPYYLAITGVLLEDLLGEVPTLLKLGHGGHEKASEIWSFLAEGKVWRGEVRGRTPLGMNYEEDVIVAPIKSSQGGTSSFVVIKKDVTHVKNLEQQLHHAQKMEAIGQLAGGVAHDFNNILSIISGHTEYAMEELGAAHPVVQDLNEVMGACDKASSLVRQLLLWSRSEEIVFSHIKINKVLRDITKMIHRVIGEHIEVQFSPWESELTINGDAGQIEQVILNLCINARDAMARGGILVLETERVILDADFCELHPGSVEGSYVKISVSDTGTGMSMETRERIFEPFFTTKGSHEGTGLGLSTVYAIVMRHGGVIDVKSDPGHGTMFSIYLPRVRLSDKKDSMRIAQLRTERGSGQGYTILLAEDDHQLRKLSSRILKKEGYSVIEATDGEEAISLFDERHSEIDVVLLDVVMPLKSGKEVYQYMRARDTSLPILFTSGYSYKILEKEGLSKDEVTFLRKPFTRSALLGFIEEAVQSRTEKPR